MKLGVALGWHGLAFEELLDAVRQAESLGFAAAFVDGDVTQLDSRGDGDVLEGWTVTTALLARTQRIAIGSIRLVHHWNAARLAQAVATLERIAPGRLRFLVSIGGQPGDRRFGMPLAAPGERLDHLDETLDALRALWRGEEVTRHGRHVTLEGARVRPIPRGGHMPIEIAGRGPRLLELVAAHADAWDVNLPPIQSRVEAAASHLERACRLRNRDPEEIRRSMWIFTRVGADPADPALGEEYRRLNPWFGDLSRDELRQAMVAGSAAECRERIADIAERLQLDLPVVDLSGLNHDAVRRHMDALASR